MPAALLGLFALAAVVHVITSPEHVVHDAFGTIGLFFLMLSLARTTFLLLYHGIVVRSMSREAPRIIGDLVQGLFFAAALTVVLRAAGVEIGSLLRLGAAHGGHRLRAAGHAREPVLRLGHANAGALRGG
ncbi:MAG: hypothetical protein IPG17_02815 [Sandaracinaceae bacterium]|nr:hypothetical protein [Sandaracinaceae bacterium]